MPAGVATGVDYARLVLGLAAVVAGAHLVVGAAEHLARMIGVSDWVIGITVVAAGTSLPELATALMAAHRGRMAMMAGTLIGSDLFNVLGVLGLAAFIHPLVVTPGVHKSLLLMAAMMILLLIFMRSGWRLTRAEGLILIACALLRWSIELAA